MALSTCTSFLIRTGGPHSLLLCIKIRAGGACYIMCNVHTLYIRHYRYMMGLTYLLHEPKPAYIVVRPPGLVHYLKSYTWCEFSAYNSTCIGLPISRYLWEIYVHWIYDLCTSRCIRLHRISKENLLICVMNLRLLIRKHPEDTCTFNCKKVWYFIYITDNIPYYSVYEWAAPKGQAGWTDPLQWMI
jgi:hypothetical protein